MNTISRQFTNRKKMMTEVTEILTGILVWFFFWSRNGQFNRLPWLHTVYSKRLRISPCGLTHAIFDLRHGRVGPAAVHCRREQSEPE